MKELDDKFFDQLLRESLAEQCPEPSRNFTFEVMAKVNPANKKQLAQTEKYAFWKDLSLGVGFLFSAVVSLFALKHYGILSWPQSFDVKLIDFSFFSRLTQLKHFSTATVLLLSGTILSSAEYILKRKLKM
ncbi:MAG: hypothetical protein MI784_06710 [Cytophagales bacterium]|nr:hypothetical protein [Cytophagales bacterium]